MKDSRNAAGARYEYVLGDSSLEAERLDRQAQLWDPYAHRLFERIGVSPGWSVLEVGPGRGSVSSSHRQWSTS